MLLSCCQKEMLFCMGDGRDIDVGGVGDGGSDTLSHFATYFTLRESISI